MSRIITNVLSIILSKMFNVAYAVEILKISRVTSTKSIFIKHCSNLISRMINKEGNIDTISKTLSKTFSRHVQSFSKLFTKSLELVESICTKSNYIWLFWLEQIMNYLLGFNHI